MELFWNVLLPAFVIPFLVVSIPIMLRKHFHDLWTPAVDVFAVLLAAEVLLLIDHGKLPQRVFGADLVGVLAVLLIVTASLLILSLVVEDVVIRAFLIRQWLRGARVGRRSSRWAVYLWAAAISIFGLHLVLFLGGSYQPTMFAISGK